MAKNRPCSCKLKSTLKLTKIAAAALLAKLGLAEEESILTGAVMIDNGHFETDKTNAPDELLKDGFKSLILTVGGED